MQRRLDGGIDGGGCLPCVIDPHCVGRDLLEDLVVGGDVVAGVGEERAELFLRRTSCGVGPPLTSTRGALGEGSATTGLRARVPT